MPFPRAAPSGRTLRVRLRARLSGAASFRWRWLPPSRLRLRQLAANPLLGAWWAPGASGAGSRSLPQAAQKHLEALEPVLADIVRLYYCLGWRQREVLELTWGEVDLEAATLTLPASRTVGVSELLEGGDKAGVRVLQGRDPPDELRRIRASHRSRSALEQAEEREDGIGNVDDPIAVDVSGSARARWSSGLHGVVVEDDAQGDDCEDESDGRGQGEGCKLLHGLRRGELEGLLEARL